MNCITQVSASSLAFCKSSSSSSRNSKLELLVAANSASPPDDLLQEALYALSKEQNPSTEVTAVGGDLLSWLALQLSSKAVMTADDPPSSWTGSDLEWWMGMHLLARLVNEMSPFELHVTVEITLDSAEDPSQQTTAFICLCLLLCTHALKQCRDYIGRSESIRWKRWQSLVCQTIRLYQQYALPIMLDAPKIRDTLWTQYVLPACRHVVKFLPSDSRLPRIAFMAGMIGTTTHLLTKHIFAAISCNVTSHECAGQSRRSPLENIVMESIKSIAPVIGYHFERWAWCHPWRVYYEKFYIAPDNDRIQFLSRRNDLGWWTEHAGKHDDAAAGMDTSWDMVGLAIMAVYGLEYRPLVMAPRYVWILWFPHISVLLETSGAHDCEEAPDNPGSGQPEQSIDFRTDMALSLLEKLIVMTPQRSLTPFQHGKIKRKNNAFKQWRPDYPMGTFQLLSNLVVAGFNKDSIHSSLQKRLMSIMNSLLALYEPTHQVYIVDNLIQNCPHVGFESKLFDMLRPLVSRSDTPDVFWQYLDKVVDDISDHVVEAGTTCQLVEVDFLIDKVEIYISLTTMLQLWLLVHFEPPLVEMGVLFSFSRALKASLIRWSQGTDVVPPDDYFRLYLLDNVLDEVLKLDEDVKAKQQQRIVGP